MPPLQQIHKDRGGGLVSSISRGTRKLGRPRGISPGEKLIQYSPLPLRVSLMPGRNAGMPSVLSTLPPGCIMVYTAATNSRLKLKFLECELFARLDSRLSWPLRTTVACRHEFLAGGGGGFWNFGNIERIVEEFRENWRFLAVCSFWGRNLLVAGFYVFPRFLIFLRGGSSFCHWKTVENHVKIVDRDKICFFIPDYVLRYLKLWIPTFEN